MRKNNNNRLLTIIISVYVAGIFSAFLLVKPTIISLSSGGVSIWGIIQTFSLNYWYVFLIWLFGMSIIGYALNIFIIYFRGFIYGLLIIFLIKINFSYLLLVSLVEIVIFIPVFFVLSYQSIMLSYSRSSNNRITINGYNKLLLVVTIVIFIYSILLEIIGGMYG